MHKIAYYEFEINPECYENGHNFVPLMVKTWLNIVLFYTDTL